MQKQNVRLVTCHEYCHVKAECQVSNMPCSHDMYAKITCHVVVSCRLPDMSCGLEMHGR